MALANVSLDDKYAFEAGRIYLTGTQALARLILTQRRRDASAGLNTAGYVWDIADRRWAVSIANCGA